MNTAQKIKVGIVAVCLIIVIVVMTWFNLVNFLVPFIKNHWFGVIVGVIVIVIAFYFIYRYEEKETKRNRI